MFERNGGYGKMLERYENYEKIKPAKFSEVFRNQDATWVQVHQMDLGFVGTFCWKNNEIVSLDGDDYKEDMLIYGYQWFKNRGGCTCLDILVDKW